MSNGDKKPAGCGVAVILLLIALGGSLLVNILLGVVHMAQFAAAGPSEAGVDEHPQFVERWSYGAPDGVKVVRIPVEGAIMRRTSSGLLGSVVDVVEDVKRQVRAARQDGAVAAIILEVNSPGGAVTPCDEIYWELSKFKASRPDRRIVVFVKDMAASGGYLVSMAADWIIAQPTSVTGSIGVMMQTYNWNELSERIGVRDVTIVSGDNKAMLNPFDPVSGDHVAMLQDMINETNTHFKNLIVQGRNMDAAWVDQLADGRMFSATKALEVGLIDEIGYWDEALARTAGLLGVPSLHVVGYEQAGGLLRQLFSAKGPDIGVTLDTLGTPRQMAIWRAGAGR